MIITTCKNFEPNLIKIQNENHEAPVLTICVFPRQNEEITCVEVSYQKNNIHICLPYEECM